MTLKEAKEIMKFYGFINDNIEPTLCQKNDDIGIFATFKTDYGHLSRFIKFSNKDEMKDFMTLYLYYRKNLKKDNLKVVFDDYEDLSPKISFYYNNIKINKNNIIDLKIIDNPVEKLEIDTTLDDNKKLLEILKNKIYDFIKIIKETEEKATKISEEYYLKIEEFAKISGENLEKDKIEIKKINEESINKRLQLLNSDVNDHNFMKKFDEILKIYEDVMNDSKYIENLYLIDYYSQEINKINQLIDKFNRYQELSNKKSKLFKKKITFMQYIEENPVISNNIDKQSIIEDNHVKSSNELIEWKNNSVDDLKSIYGITKKVLDSNILKNCLKTQKEDLDNYFESLSMKERNQAIFLSSPLKELVNIIVNYGNEDLISAIFNEKYYRNKFNEMYEILSNKDNYLLTRKYLKMLRLDSLEEFVSSIIDFTKNINIKPYTLKNDDVLKYKMGVFLKKGYINASLLNNYPINNRGDNNYYVSSIKNPINVYYSPYIIKIDESNNLIASKNSDIITFDINNLKIVDKSEIKVNNYILRREKLDKEVKYSYILFNEKVYLDTVLENKN